MTCLVLALYTRYYTWFMLANLAYQCCKEWVVSKSNQEEVVSSKG